MFFACQVCGVPLFHSTLLESTLLCRTVTVFGLSKYHSDGYDSNICLLVCLKGHIHKKYERASGEPGVYKHS